jgi:hypothetical protein
VPPGRHPPAPGPRLLLLVTARFPGFTRFLHALLPPRGSLSRNRAYLSFLRSHSRAACWVCKLPERFGRSEPPGSPFPGQVLPPIECSPSQEYSSAGSGVAHFPPAFASFLRVAFSLAASCSVTGVATSLSAYVRVANGLLWSASYPCLLRAKTEPPGIRARPHTKAPRALARFLGGSRVLKRVVPLAGPELRVGLLPFLFRGVSSTRACGMARPCRYGSTAPPGRQPSWPGPRFATTSFRLGSRFRQLSCLLPPIELTLA